MYLPKEIIQIILDYHQDLLITDKFNLVMKQLKRNERNKKIKDFLFRNFEIILIIVCIIYPFILFFIMYYFQTL